VTALISRPDLDVMFPPTRHAPAAARRLLESAGMDNQLEHTVKLLVSELVTNSLVHAPGVKGVALRAVLARDYARIEVRDTGAGFDAERVEWGVGLRLLDMLAARWGVEQGSYGVVWFEVDHRPTRFRRQP
jgi:anti-sigma regulatory factor (Ser/Thr protein kinase)